jgi:LPXTG-motif cell wall-anchored protein
VLNSVGRGNRSILKIRRSLFAGAILTIALGAVLAVGFGSASGAAASDELLLSRDGVHYSPVLDGGLFDGAGSLVPGHAVAASLWIKNPSSEATALRMSVHDVAWSSSALSRALTLTTAVGTPGVGGSTSTAIVPQSCAVLTSVSSVPAGKSVHIDVRLAMADVAETTAQSNHVALNFLVAMKGQSGGPFGASACNDEGEVIGATTYRTVASTGGTVPVPLIVGGGLLIGVGIFLVARRRKPAEHD